MVRIRVRARARVWQADGHLRLGQSVDRRTVRLRKRLRAWMSTHGHGHGHGHGRASCSKSHVPPEGRLLLHEE
eukprot:scaffold18754_cov54-Phaeocystis_antarctica.AAC.2